MKNKAIAVALLGSIIGSGAYLWASAGDSTLTGQAGTTTGQPAAKTPTKKHHGHHGHKKPAPAASSTSTGSAAPATK